MSASTKSPLVLGFVSPRQQAAAAPAGRTGSALRTTGINLRGLADAWIPDRQIIIRGPGNVSALRISQRAQLAAALSVIAILLALALTTAGCVLACRADARAAAAAAKLQSALTTAKTIIATEQQAYLTAKAQRDDGIGEADRARDAAIAQADRARDIAVTQARQARDLAIARANTAALTSAAALDALIQQTQAVVGKVDTVITSTGLDPNRLASPLPTPTIGATRPPAMASNFNLPAAGAAAARPQAAAIIPAPLAMPAGLPTDSLRRAALLITDLRRLEVLGDVLAQMPLASPTAQAIISSPFGFRFDPFTGVPEFHVGIDLPGPIGAPIYATAPGIVTFAGIANGYGNLVTIDHGYGLSTRYSHLDKILVKPGETVALHQEIGLMGNTGWSTGPHLLYETRVDGQPRNPLNFIKVNPYDVQK